MKKKRSDSIKSKQRMVDALIQLSKEKPMSEITISEITEKAQVARMTYYRNYNSKEDILKKQLADIITEFKEETNHFDGSKFGEYENIKKCFMYFEKYQEFFRTLINVGMADALLEGINEYLLYTYYNDESDDIEYYTLLAYSGSLFNMYVAWLSNNCSDKIEKMTDILYRIYR